MNEPITWRLIGTIVGIFIVHPIVTSLRQLEEYTFIEFGCFDFASSLNLSSLGSITVIIIRTSKLITPGACQFWTLMWIE